MPEILKMLDSGFPLPPSQQKPIQKGHANPQETVKSMDFALEKAIQDNSGIVLKKISLQSIVK
jgi:hypothetical protein